MKNLDRNVVLLCPLCGNDQFESLDSVFDELIDASDDVKLRCSDCNSIYTKQELLAENSEVIETAVEEIKSEAIKEIEKELKKAFKKWKF